MTAQRKEKSAQSKSAAGQGASKGSSRSGGKGRGRGGGGGRRGRRTKNMIKIANERIQMLFEFTENERKRGKHDKLDRYVELARKIGMRYNVRIPLKYKWKYCKHCYSYLDFGRTADTRLRSKFIIIHCRSCGKHMRRSIKSLENK